MKILYDHQIFTSQKYGGISRYFYELIKLIEFEKDESIQVTTSCLLSNNHYITNKDCVNHINFISRNEFRGKIRIMSLINTSNSILKLRKQSFDIFHPTYYDDYFLKHIGNKPYVVTVHDMIHEKFSNLFPKNDKTSFKKRKIVTSASKIIAISENTKKDLIELFKIQESKIEVIYHGNSLSINNIDKNKMLKIELPKKYILFVGERGGYKNFFRFINSTNKLLNEDKDLTIVCVGGRKFTETELLLLKTLKNSNRILRFDLNDQQLIYFYSNALAFVFPSLYEGLGIPILEAFACKCPLICSNTGSFPEIAHNAAEYFDPYDNDSIYNSIKKVIYKIGRASCRERV